MQVTDEARYRLRLAEGFLQEARQDLALQRWRSCVDNSQLAVENAAKAALAFLGPVGRTHNPATLLRQALADRRFPQEVLCGAWSGRSAAADFSRIGIEYDRGHSQGLDRKN